MNLTKGVLYLIPALLGDTELGTSIPAAVRERISTIDHFVAENPKTARAFLKLCGTAKPLQELRIETLDQHTPEAATAALAAPLVEGHDLGMLSEAGCPGIADPGARLALYAHQHGVRVVPLVGPSSILLALMASGLNGQSFAFNGYLPVPPSEREKSLREFEKQSRRLRQTQVFIETPYRNMKFFGSILETCSPNTLLCVACDLTTRTESIRTLTVGEWRRQKPDLDKRPCVFLLLAG